MVLDPIPQSLPVHFFGSRPQPPTSPRGQQYRSSWISECLQQRRERFVIRPRVEAPRTATHCNTLQHTTTHYNTLQHTAVHCNTLQTYCNTYEQTCESLKSRDATHCNTLQHTATHYSPLKRTAKPGSKLQHMNRPMNRQDLDAGPATATHCNTLQHTAIHCKK